MQKLCNFDPDKRACCPVAGVASFFEPRQQRQQERCCCRFCFGLWSSQSELRLALSPLQLESGRRPANNMRQEQRRRQRQLLLLSPLLADLYRISKNKNILPYAGCRCLYRLSHHESDLISIISILATNRRSIFILLRPWVAATPDCHFYILFYRR